MPVPKTPEHIAQTQAVQDAYDALLNIYRFSAVPEITKRVVIGAAMDKLAAAFPNDETPYAKF